MKIVEFHKDGTMTLPLWMYISLLILPLATFAIFLAVLVLAITKGWKF